MSSGKHSFTSNHRVEIKTFPDKWVLKIEPVLEKDDGYYECQVNTRETMSLVFKLNVERKSLILCLVFLFDLVLINGTALARERITWKGT